VGEASAKIRQERGSEMITEIQERVEKDFNGLIKTLTEVCPVLKRKFELEERDEEMLSFSIDGIPFTVGWGEAPTPAIGGMRWRVVYTLSIWYTTAGGRWHPPETVDTELIDSPSINDCVRKALQTVANAEIDGALENQGYKEMLEEEKNLEQV
jgi:hypothetical protein